LRGLDRAHRRARAEEMLELVGLAGYAERFPAQLSGGQQQRVAIARAIVNEPEIVLADEPTGNLDSKTGAEVLRLIREATRERHLTVVMVTHDPKAAEVGDRLVRLADGAVVGDELLRAAA